jgi:hypothetical protein
MFFSIFRKKHLFFLGIFSLKFQVSAPRSSPSAMGLPARADSFKTSSNLTTVTVTLPAQTVQSGYTFKYTTTGCSSPVFNGLRLTVGVNVACTINAVVTDCGNSMEIFFFFLFY